MKRIISLLVVAIMLLSIFTVTAFAQTTDNFDYYGRFVEEFGEPYYYREQFVSFKNNEPSYYVVQAMLELIYVDPPQNIEDVGIVNSGLVFTQIPIKNPFVVGYGIYDVDDDKFYDIAEIDIKAYDGLFDYLIESDIATMIGDVDYDDSVTVMDATMIQKILANITHIRNNYITDFNCDGSVDILDATAVQAYVAKLVPEVPTVNENLVYVPYNDNFNITDGIVDISYTASYNSRLEYGDHKMDSSNFGVIIKSKEQFLSVFNFDIEKYDEEFFDTKALVATVMIVTDYNMTSTICYAGVHDNTLVLVNQKSLSGSGNIALPMAPPYVSIIEINKSDVAYVDDIIWVKT